MKDEYIIINKTTLEKRIEELRQTCNKELGYASDKIYFELDNFLSQSTPLIPEIEKSMDTLRPHVAFDDLYETKKEYISNLKLNV